MRRDAGREYRRVAAENCAVPGEVPVPQLLSFPGDSNRRARGTRLYFGRKHYRGMVGYSRGRISAPVYQTALTDDEKDA